MESESLDSCVTVKDDCFDSEVSCLMRVGRDSDWLRLFENVENTVGRGVDVTYQLLSPSCPLMISRLHCTFRQSEDGQWAVTDKKSLNGVWVNGSRIPAEEAHQLRHGDSIQLGVPLCGAEVEYDYVLVRRPLTDIMGCLAKARREVAKTAHLSKKPKRKLEEVEPSTSKPKLYRCSSADKCLATPCPLPPVNEPQRPGHVQPAETRTSGQLIEVDQPSESSPSDLELLQTNHASNMPGGTRQAGASPKGGPEKTGKVREQQGRLETLRTLKHRVKTLKKGNSGAALEPEQTHKTQQREEQMKKRLEEALHECHAQQKVIGELALSRQAYEEILSAKNKELEVTKEEKEKARAQKDKVVTQVTEVMENELQCIICSELFIEAVTLGCAHSFCHYCIGQWRKRRDECPICRQPIQSQTRCLALDNCIDSMVENLSADMKARRRKLITERKAGSTEAPVMEGGDGGSRLHSDCDTTWHPSTAASHPSTPGFLEYRP